MNKWKMLRPLMILCTLLFFSSGALAGKPAPPPSDEAILFGKVRDSVSTKGIPSASVVADGAAGTFSVIADSKGAYTFNLPPGDFAVTASAMGYQDVSISFTAVAGATTSQDFNLEVGITSVLPHANKITNYTGPETCLSCHNSSIADEVFQSAHFQARTPALNVDMPGGGSHGMMDRACGLPGTTMMANNFAGKAISPVDGTTVRNEGCGSCHIAYLPPYYYPDAASATPDLDCLRCHATVYGEEWELQENIDTYGENAEPHAREVVTNAQGMEVFSQDRSTKTAQSVGGAVTSHACDRCHEHGMSGYKRSTPFTAEADQHVTKGLECTSCHLVAQHRIARGNYVTDGIANDMPEVEVGCITSGCHTSTPHSVNPALKDDLNRHVANVTCEACHIHSMDEPKNVYRRSWAPSTLNPVTGQWEDTAAGTDYEYAGFWDAYTEYFEIGTRPTLRWFNGGASMLAQPYGGFDDRRTNGGDSRLFAFKPFVSGMLFDAAWLPGPPQDGSFDMVNATWPASMKYFYEANWNTFLAFGMADSTYATAAEYWVARPDMAMMLNNFPMMLMFERKTFLETGGDVIGTPAPGPQSAANYPGVANAINRGMGKMAIDMGYFPQETPLADAGANMWSGSFFGMWVPPNMDPASAFYGEVASFITMSHAVKSNTGYDGTACYACHFTDDEYAGTVSPSSKYLDYAKLGYPDLDLNGLSDPMHDQELVPEICTDGLDNDGDSAVDCADADCVSDPTCAVSASEDICSDGIDNDTDGAIDCADSDCYGIDGCGAEGKFETCSDGIDNDGDGATDCDDAGCAKNKSCK